VSETFSTQRILVSEEKWRPKMQDMNSRSEIFKKDSMLQKKNASGMQDVKQLSPS
jgi:hypothetical protein